MIPAKHANKNTKWMTALSAPDTWMWHAPCRNLNINGMTASSATQPTAIAFSILRIIILLVILHGVF